MLPQLITKYECKGCQSIYMNQGELDHHTSRCITVAAKNHTMMSSKPTAPSTAGTLSRINKYSFKTLEKKQTALKDGGVSRGRMLSSSPDSQMTETQSSTVLSTVIKVEDPSTLLDLTNIKDSEPCELMMTDVTSCVPATDLPVSLEVLVPETPSTPITTDRGEDRSVLSTLAVSRVSGTLSDSEVPSSKKCTNMLSKTETRQEALAVIRSGDFTCRYLTSSDFSDATVTTSLADIPIHKVVLASKYPQLSQGLLSVNTLDMSAISYSHVSAWLKYVYTGDESALLQIPTDNVMQISQFILKFASRKINLKNRRVASAPRKRQKKAAVSGGPGVKRRPGRPRGSRTSATPKDETYAINNESTTRVLPRTHMVTRRSKKFASADTSSVSLVPSPHKAVNRHRKSVNNIRSQRSMNNDEFLSDTSMRTSMHSPETPIDHSQQNSEMANEMNLAGAISPLSANKSLELQKMFNISKPIENDIGGNSSSPISKSFDNAISSKSPRGRNYARKSCKPIKNINLLTIRGKEKGTRKFTPSHSLSKKAALKYRQAYQTKGEATRSFDYNIHKFTDNSLVKKNFGLCIKSQKGGGRGRKRKLHFKSKRRVTEDSHEMLSPNQYPYADPSEFSSLDFSRVPIVDIEKLPPQSSSHKSSLISQEAIEYDSLRTDDACFGNEDQMSSTDSVTVETYDTSPIAVDLSTNSESFAGTPSADVKKKNHSIGNFPAAGAKGLSENTEDVMPGQVLDGGTVEQANADHGNEQDVTIHSEDAEFFGDSLEITSLDFTKLEPSVGPKDVEVSMNEAELSLPVAQMDDFRGLGRVKGKQLFLDDVSLPSTRCRPKAGLPGNSVSPSVSGPLASPNAWKLAKDMRTPHRKGTHKAYVPSPFTPMDDFGTLSDDQLKKRLRSFGLRDKMSRKRMVAALTQIYVETHQYETDTSADFTVLPTPSRKTLPSPDFAVYPTPSRKTLPSPNFTVHPTPSKEALPSPDRTLEAEQDFTLKVKKESTVNIDPTQSDELNSSPCKVDGGGDRKSIIPASVADINRLLEEVDVLLDDDEMDDSYSSSSMEATSSHEELCDEDITSGLNLSSPQDIEASLFSLIRQNKEVYDRVLRYEMIQKEELLQLIQSAGINCSAKDLQAFCFKQCLPIQNKHSQRNRQRKLKRQKKQ